MDFESNRSQRRRRSCPFISQRSELHNLNKGGKGSTVLMLSIVSVIRAPVSRTIITQQSDSRLPDHRHTAQCQLSA